MSPRLRLAGARWRLLVHEWRGRSPGHRDGTYGISHTVEPGKPARPDGRWNRSHVLPGTEFDELAVGAWLHVEQTDSGRWYIDVGGVRLDVAADRDGHPTRVQVYGPGDFDEPRDGCTYECVWSAE